MSLSKVEILQKLNSDVCIDKFKSLGINSVIVFGSILTEGFMEYSDVDIAVLSESEIKLNIILALEEYLGKNLQREIDVINLTREDLDLAMKVSVYDNGLLIYNDDLNLYDKEYLKTEMRYKSNETFRFFRERDVIWDE